jgi:hypothetical protein
MIHFTLKVKSKLNSHNLYLKRTKLSSNVERSLTNLFKLSHKILFQHKLTHQMIVALKSELLYNYTAF